MAILYAVDSSTGVLYIIDSLKGTAIPVGQLGLQTDFSGLSSQISDSAFIFFKEK